MDSISCRKRFPLVEEEFLRPLVNYGVVTDENGNTKSVPEEVVKPAKACDFSVISRAMYSRSASLPIRENIDPVDLFENPFE